MPQNNLGFYAHHNHPHVLSPWTSSGTVNIRSPRAPPMPFMEEIAGFVLNHHPIGNNMMHIGQNEIHNGKTYNHKKTLELFPLHPTGVLEERVDTSSNTTCITNSACTASNLS